MSEKPPGESPLPRDAVLRLVDAALSSPGEALDGSWWEAGANPDAAPALEGPRRFGRYELLEEIARGGMGIVYRARQRDAQRLVALKTILPQQLGSRGLIERFRAEAEAAASLDHPAVLPIFEVGECDGLPFFSMKLAERGSLAALAKPLPPREAAALMAQVAHAVHHAHQRGILHRDLKPANILLGAAGEPFVSDFGLAKWLSRASDLTQTQVMLGTPAYLAPEQATGGPATATVATDVHALGAIFYELLTGRPPYAAPTLVETLRQIAHEAPTKPSSLVPGLPRDFEVVCLACLEKSPTVRYASAAAFAADLENALSGRALRARPASAPAQLARWARRNPLAATLSSALLVALAASATIASVSAVRIAASRDRAVAAEHEVSLRLRDSLVAQARASRRIGRAGQRFDALDALRQAATLGPTVEMRHEAAAALALPDLRVERILAERGQAASGLAYDPVRQRYATERAPGEIVVYPLSTDANADAANATPAAPVIVLPAPADGAALAFLTPPAGDGRFLVARHYPGDRVRVWDLTTQALVVEFTARPTGGIHPIFSTDAALSPDGHTLALGLPEGGVSFHDLLAGGRETGRLATDGRVSVLAYDPSGTHLAVATKNAGVARVYSLADGRERYAITHAAAVLTLAFSPDGRWLASGGRDTLITLSDARTGAARHTLRGHKHRINQVTFSPDSTVLASTSQDASIRLWDVRQGQPLVTLTSEGDEPVLRFSSDGRHLFTGSYLPTPKVLRFGAPEAWTRLHSPATPETYTNFSAVDWSFDGRLILSSTPIGTRLLDARHGETLALLAEGGDVKGALFDPRGPAVFTSSETSPLHRRTYHFETTDAGERLALSEPEVLLDAPGFSLNGHRADGRVLGLTSRLHGQVWLVPTDRAAGLKPVLLDKAPDVWSVALRLDGRLALTSSGNAAGGQETLTLWSAETGAQLRRFDEIGANGLAAFRPDGKQVFAFGNQGNALLDTADWQRRPTLTGEVAGESEFVAYSPRGDLLAVLVGDRVHLLDPKTGQLLIALEAPDLLGGRSVFAFAPDGQGLALLTADGAVSRWDLRALRRELAALGLDW